MNRFALFVLCAMLLASGAATAKSGDADKGKEIYDKRCAGCHGEEGDGEGAAKDFLNPPPRDFTSGSYKIRTSSFEDIAPNDDDIFRMIRDGMPGTAMPGWESLLSEQEMWDLVAYVKIFAGYEEPPAEQVDFGSRVSSSPDSIEKGRKLFEQGDRCVECHGKSGKGNASKRLKGDAGERTWPRNLTKPWTFRGSSNPKDIFARLSTGIAGTEMPSFADPKSKKMLSIEERWHVANYVASLSRVGKKVEADNSVIKADRIEGDLPDSTEDKRWEETTPTTFYLVPQLVGEERYFKPSNDTLTVRGLYNGKAVAILLEWDDRTKSIPGDENAGKLADAPIAEDAVAVQLPVVIPKGMEKPYFGMGDATHPVNIWHWKSGTAEAPERISLFNSRGFREVEHRDAATTGLEASSSYSDGTWRVLMTRPLATLSPEKDVQLSEGRFIPIAFAAWDGSNNSEKGSKHTLTTWYWLLLKPATGSAPFVTALLVIFLLAGGLFWWARSTTTKPAG